MKRVVEFIELHLASAHFQPLRCVLPMGQDVVAHLLRSQFILDLDVQRLRRVSQLFAALYFVLLEQFSLLPLVDAARRAQHGLRLDS